MGEAKLKDKKAAADRAVAKEKSQKKAKRAMAAKAVIDQKMMQNHVRDAKEQGEKKAKAVQEKAKKATTLVEVAINKKSAEVAIKVKAAAAKKRKIFATSQKDYGDAKVA